ncbi:MAG TPA: VanZ family protein [Candidatus Deferrimicrobiaceae bacterium]
MNRRRLYFWLLASWLALTITLTSLPNPNFRIDVPHQDKVAHLSFYGVIGFLFALWRRESGDSASGAVVGALLFVAAFGAFDEIHQRFIPGRSMDILDWTADVAGGMAGGTMAVFAPLLRPLPTTR